MPTTAADQAAALCDIDFAPEEIAAFVADADNLLRSHNNYEVFRRFAETDPAALYAIARPALVGAVLALSLAPSVWIGPVAQEVATRGNPIRSLEQKMLFECLIRTAAFTQDSPLRVELQTAEVNDELVEQRVQAWTRSFPINTLGTTRGE